MNIKNMFGSGRGLISTWLGNNTEKKKTTNTTIGRRKIGYTIVVLIFILYIGAKVVIADPGLIGLAPSGITTQLPNNQTAVIASSATSAPATAGTNSTAQPAAPGQVVPHQSNAVDWLIDAGIKIALTLFIYVNVIVTKIFILLFGFVTKFIFLLIDWGNFNNYPSQFSSVLNNVLRLVYIVSLGFVFILFIQSMLNSLWRGEDPSKSIMGLVFALVLIFCVPLLFTYMFEIFNAISVAMQTYATGAFQTANGQSNSNFVVSNLMQISSFMGNTSQNGFQVTADLFTDQGSTAIGNAASSAVTDIATIAGIVGDRLEYRDYPFFINQVLMFIVSVVGILECFEVIVLKAGQTLALIMAFFSGIFAAALVTNESTSNTFWDWLKKTAQLFSYNFYWALIIIFINIFAYWMTLSQPFAGQSLDSATANAWKMLFFVCVLAGIKMMSKVGGIAEGLVMSSRVMQNFGQSVIGNLRAAGGIVKTAGEASVVGGAAVVGAAMAGSKGALGMANLLQRKANDPGTSVMDHFKDMKYEGGQKQALNSGNISRAQYAANMTKLDNFSSQGQGGGSSLRTSSNSAPGNTSGSDISGSSGPVSGKTREQWQQIQRPKGPQ